MLPQYFELRLLSLEYSFKLPFLGILFCVFLIGCSPDRESSNSDDSVDRGINLDRQITIPDENRLSHNSPVPLHPSVVPYTSAIPPVEHLGDIRTVNAIWSRDYELLDGEARFIFAQDSTLYILGSKFDTSAYPEAFQRYQSEPERSVYTHISEFFPSFVSVLTAFVSKYSLEGIERSHTTVDASGTDTVKLAFPVENGVAFLVHSMLQGNLSSLSTTLGVADNTGIHYTFKQSKERVNIRHAGKLLIDYTPLLDAESETDSVLIYEAGDGPTGLSSRLIKYPRIFAQGRSDIFDAAYIHNGKIFGWNGDMLFEIQMDDNTAEVFNLSYNGQGILPQIKYLQAEYRFDRSYLIGELDLPSGKGFFWSFSEYERDREYSYVLPNRLSINSMLVVSSGVFLTGTQDKKMLLMLLNHDGEVQWRAHLGEGVLRGITEYNGRYFVVGDRLEIRTDEDNDAAPQ